MALQPTPPSKQEVLVRLIRETADEDWEAFSKLYAMTSQTVFGVMLRMTRYAPDCEDLLQEVYVTLWRRAKNYDPGQSQVMTWIITIARNRTIDWLRSKGSGIEGKLIEPSPDALDLAAGGSSPEQVAERAGASTDLEQCLQSLSHDQRQAVVLAYLEGHSHAELADRLASPLGTVKSWIRRGLSRLRSCLSELGGAA